MEPRFDPQTLAPLAPEWDGVSVLGVGARADSQDARHPVSAAPPRVFMSQVLRPDEYLDIVAAGRRP